MPVVVRTVPVVKDDAGQGQTLLGCVLSLYARLAHWNVRGPDFPQLHEMFGELYGDAWESIDDIAQQLRQPDMLVAPTMPPRPRHFGQAPVPPKRYHRPAETSLLVRRYRPRPRRVGFAGIGAFNALRALLRRGWCWVKRNASACSTWPSRSARRPGGPTASPISSGCPRRASPRRSAAASWWMAGRRAATWCSDAAGGCLRCTACDPRADRSAGRRTWPDLPCYLQTRFTMVGPLVSPAEKAALDAVQAMEPLTERCRKANDLFTK